MTDSIKRTPAGIPTGGQFASHDRADGDVQLTADTPIRMGAMNELAVPGPYSISGYKSVQGREGPMWSAKLKRDGKVVAELIQDGNGGMTRDYFVNREESELFDQYAAKWTHTWGGADYSFPHNRESVLDWFGEEADTAKALNRARRSGTVYMETADTTPEVGYGIFRVPDSPESRAKVLEKLPNAVFWDGKSWVSGTA